MKIKKKLLKLIAKHIPGCGLRIALLRWCGYIIGKDVYIGEDLIVIDDLSDTQLNLNIGDRVAISPRVTLVMHTQPNNSRVSPYVNSHVGSITIQADAWIGTGSVILPNVTIGEGAVVGGVPAHFIKPVKVPWYQRQASAD
jgi:acetyltransferase-like isoleucine patch superfamily enzyme